MKVWCVMESDTYDASRTVGVCSSEERAELAAECLKRYRYDGTYCVGSFEVDEILQECREYVNDELSILRECESFLERMAKLEESSD